MRLWPFRGRRAAPAQPAEDLLVTEDVLRRSLEDVLAVRGRQIRGGMIVFRGDLLVEPARALDVLLDRFRPFGYTPFLRAEGDGVVVQAWPLADARAPQRVRTNVLLFALTCLSVLAAGAQFVGSPTFDALRTSPSLVRLLAGAPFALTLMGILGVHEFGHYFTARYHRAAVSLPYFIPLPFGWGTLGAIILMRSPARTRDAMFDIAVAGPLAGLAVALPAMILGLAWSSVAPIPAGGYAGFGDSLLTGLLAWLRFGALPAGHMIYTHPVADAAWAGFLVTALNLFPVGQLDGGRISYALFGRRHRTIGRVTVAVLLAFGVLLLAWSLFAGKGIIVSVNGSLNWFVWAGLIYFVVGFRESPPLDDLTPLSPGRCLLGALCLFLLVLLIPPFLLQEG